MTNAAALTNLKLCTNCILPETFPGVSFNEDGLCRYCEKEKVAQQKLPEKKEQYKKQFDELIANTRDKAPSYDVLMAYSGGKDSSYTLKILREQYDLRVLALCFDNNFVSPQAMDNINKVTDTLHVDLIMFKAPWGPMRDMFNLTTEKDIFSPTTLLRASSICTSCIGTVKAIVLKTALEMSIPLVGYGWSPGQAPIQSAIMKTNPDLVKKAQKTLYNSYPEETQKFMNRYFLPDNYYDMYRERFPTNIHPLAFFDYDEQDIVKGLNQLGWFNPKDVDTNSSNCRVNAYGNHVHMKKHGFHPYVWEIANMVRQGVMPREEGLEKIYSNQDDAMVQYAKERLLG